MSDHRTTIRNNLLAIVAGALALALAVLLEGSDQPTAQEIAERAYICDSNGYYPMGRPSWRAHETCGGAP